MAEGRSKIDDLHGDAKLFTLDEAREMVPALRDAVHELQLLKKKLDEFRRAMRQLSPAMRANGHAEEARDLEERIQELVTVIRAGIEAIGDAGVLVKDIDMGLVDFPTMRDGRVVFLCWMTSEPDITHWHEITDGFQGRRPL